MLEVIGAAPGSHSDVDWFQVWRQSPEYQQVHLELDTMKEERSHLMQRVATQDDKASYREFAAPFAVQWWEVQKRVFEQYWRTPSYIYSKAALCLFSGLFIGVSIFPYHKLHRYRYSYIRFRVLSFLLSMKNSLSLRS